MELYIVRHGNTLWNKDKLLQGSTDIELADYGRELARITGQALMNTQIDVIYSSPLKRAYETAELIRNHRDIDIITDDRLRELCFGCFEGQNMIELKNDDSLYFKYFFDKPELYRPGEGGETLEHLIERAGDFMTDVIEPLATTKTRVMIVAHGALNKAIMCHVKRHSIEHFWSGGLQRNCNVIIVDYTDGKYTVVNETKTFY